MWSTLGSVSARALNLLSRVAAATGDAVPATTRDRRFVTPDVIGDATCDGPERLLGAGDRRRHDVVSGDRRLDPFASDRDTALPLRAPVRRVEDTRGRLPGREGQTWVAAKPAAYPPQAVWLREGPRRDRRARRLPEESPCDRSAPDARP